MTSADPVEPRPEIDPDEVARLRAEVARLKAEKEPTTSGRPAQGWWRPVVAGLLVAVAALLAPLSVLSTWASGQIQDTDRYLATVGATGQRPRRPGRHRRARRGGHLQLPGPRRGRGRGRPGARGTGAAAPGGGHAGCARRSRSRPASVASSTTASWRWSPRTPSRRPGSRPTGRPTKSWWRRCWATPGERSRSTTAAVSVNLAVLINTLKGQLVDAGFAIAERIPEVTATFTIVQSENLGKLQKLLGFLDNLSTWLPVVGLVLLAAAVMIARDRRRMVLAAGLAVAGSMLLLGAALNIIRPYYLDALPASSSRGGRRRRLRPARVVHPVGAAGCARGRPDGRRGGLVQRGSRSRRICSSRAGERDLPPEERRVPAPGCRPGGSVRSSGCTADPSGWRSWDWRPSGTSPRTTRPAARR